MDHHDDTKSPRFFSFDGHLHYPIKKEECFFLLDHDIEEFTCDRHRSLKAIINEESCSDFIYNICSDPWLCVKSAILLHEDSQINESSTRLEYQSAIQGSVRNWLIQKKTFINKEECTLESSLTEKEIIENILQDSDLYLLYLHKRKVEQIKNKIIYQKYSPGTMYSVSGCLLEKEIFIFNCRTHGVSLGPTPLFLGVLDMVQTRFDTFLYWKLIDLFRVYPFLCYHIIWTFFNTVEPYRALLNNEFFTALKTLEPLVIGKICADPVNDVGFTKLYTHSCKEIDNISAEFRQKVEPLLIFDTTGSMATRFSLELVTILKCFGHPLLSWDDSLPAMWKYTTKCLPIDSDYADKLIGLFIYKIIEGYFHEKHQWPPVQFTSLTHPRIIELHKLNQLPQKKDWIVLSTDDFSSLSLEKIADFDLSIDTNELLSDKSCAPPLSNWTQMFDPCAFKILHNQRKPQLPFEETRVMLRYLRGQENELQDVINEVESGHPDSQNDLQVLAMKELELSTTGRNFTKQTYRQRLLQTARESNIAKNVFKYIKEQTMKDTELKLKRRQFSSLRVLVNKESEVINIDLRKWNMHQRHVAHARLQKELDNFFGLSNVYQDTHLWIQRSFIMTNERTLPPKIGVDGNPEVGHYCHYNQYSGGEGLAQKLWTIQSILIILSTADQLKISVSVMGQGDNLVIVLKWKKTQCPNRTSLREQFLTVLQNNFCRMGMVIKDEETWVSSRLLEYGKIRWLNGAPIQQGAKRARRIIPDENDGICSLETSISNISTATENIAAASWTPDIAFILHGFLVINFLFRHEFIKIKNKPYDLRSLVAILHFPNILGGLPISDYPSHNVRGIPDPLSLAISLILGLKHQWEQAYIKVTQICKIKLRSVIHYESLLSDIFSLNINRIPSPSLVAKDSVGRFLKNYTTNNEVAKLLHQTTSNYQEIASQLISLRPFFAPLAHEIIRNSNAGLVLSLQQRFTNVQSVVKLANERSSFTLYTKISDADDIYLQRFRSTFFRLKYDHLRSDSVDRYIQKSTCSYVIAQEMRADSWKMDVVGVSHPVPWEQVTLYDYDAVEDHIKTDCLFTELSETFASYDSTYKEELGPFSPYFGSFTSEKVVKPKLQFTQSHPVISSLRNLLYIASWLKRLNSVTVLPLVEQLVKDKLILLPCLEEKMEFLDDLTPSSYGGSLAHRFLSSMQNRGSMINNNAAATSHIKSSTNNMKKYIRGGEDYNIFFQLIFLYIQSSLILERTSHTDQIIRCYAAVFACPCCTHSVSNQEFQLSFQSSTLTSSWTALETKILAPCLLKTSLNVNPATLVEVTGFCLGVRIGKRIDSDYQQIFSLKKLQSEEIQPGIYNDINLTMVKSSPLPSLLAGMIISSSSIRLSFKNILQKTPTVYKTSIFQSIAAILLITKRIDEFCRFVRESPLTHTEGVSPLHMSDIIHRGISQYLQHNFQDILYYYIKYPHHRLGSSVTSSIIKWICSNIFLLCSSCIHKEIEPLKSRKADIKFCLALLENQTSINLDTFSCHQLFQHSSFDDYPKEKSSLISLLHDLNYQLNTNYTNQKKLEHSYKLMDLDKDYHLHLCEMLAIYSLYNHRFREISPISITNDEDIFAMWRTQQEFKQINSNHEEDKEISPQSTHKHIATLKLKTDCLYISCSFLHKAKPVFFDSQLLKTVYNLSRSIGHISGSASSYLSILTRYKLINTIRNIEDQHNIIVCLADGSGGLCNLLMHLFPHCPVIFNTLSLPSINPTIDQVSYIPPALLGESCFDYKSRLIAFEQFNVGETDITSSVFQKKFVHVMECGAYDACIITIDLETRDYTVYRKLAEMLLFYSMHLGENGLLICRLKIEEKILISVGEFLDNYDHSFRGYFAKPLSEHQYFNTCLLIIQRVSNPTFLPDCFGLEKITPNMIHNLVHTSRETKAPINILTTAIISHITPEGLDCHGYFDCVWNEKRFFSACFSRSELVCLTRGFNMAHPMLGCLSIKSIIIELATSSWEQQESTPNMTAALIKMGKTSYLSVTIQLLIASYFITSALSVSIFEVYKVLVFLSTTKAQALIRKIPFSKDYLEIEIQLTRYDSSESIAHELGEKFKWLLSETNIPLFCSPQLTTCTHKFSSKERSRFSSKTYSIIEKLYQSLKSLYTIHIPSLI